MTTHSPFDAVILAAGLGTRLRPLTDRIPKALVEVDGLPVLERVARRLVHAGATRLVVNMAYLGDQVAGFVHERDGFGVETVLSDEPDGPYETGGGLKHAADLIRQTPFLMHNADILTNVDLRALVEAQRPSDATATLAVVPARTDRYLVFDGTGLAGYGHSGKETLMRAADGPLRRVDFCGVQAGSAALLDAVRAVHEQKFSIMDVYLRLARDGAQIAAFEAPGQAFLDIGTHEALEEAHRLVQAGVLG